MTMELKARKLEAEREKRRRHQDLEAEERRRQREHECEMRRLELQAQSGLPVAGYHRLQTPAFRIDTAIQLIPKFNEHDIESFLLSVAQLNAFSEDKYAAILQAHLTDKALKVFTELSVEDCQDYRTLKAALLIAYTVVLEVYQKRVRTLNKHHSETFSEFAFYLSVQFRCCLESEEASDNAAHLQIFVS